MKYFIKLCLYLHQNNQQCQNHKESTKKFTKISSRLRQLSKRIKGVSEKYFRKLHCVKNVRIRCYYSPYFPTFGLEKLWIRTLSMQCLNSIKQGRKNQLYRGNCIKLKFMWTKTATTGRFYVWVDVSGGSLSMVVAPKCDTKPSSSSKIFVTALFQTSVFFNTDLSSQLLFLWTLVHGSFEEGVSSILLQPCFSFFWKCSAALLQRDKKAQWNKVNSNEGEMILETWVNLIHVIRKTLARQEDSVTCFNDLIIRFS